MFYFRWLFHSELNTSARQASDLALRLGELVRSVTTPAYAIANANAPVNERLRAGIAPTNDYYRKRSQASKNARGPKKGGSGGSTP